MLIRNAEINATVIADVRCENGFITAMGNNLPRQGDEPVIDAHGDALLPSLHDHHFHFLSFAAALASVPCGPPRINTEFELISVLQNKARDIGNRGTGWLRGIGYHSSVAGEIDRYWLDRYVGQVPVRIQHRSGRLWILNSVALGMLGALADSPLEKIDGEFTGRLYDADTWLRERLSDTVPDMHAASSLLASYGITSFTDATPHNSISTAAYFDHLQDSGNLLQDVLLMGDASLDVMQTRKNLRRGARKVHLHDDRLPDSESLCKLICDSHVAARPVAIHCVTLVELIFALDAFAQAGIVTGDRIEHASIAPPPLVKQLADLGLHVVTQPNFITERGDAYLAGVEVADLPWLYRLQGFIAAGIPLAAGTDAPFGDANPWRAMQSAVTRYTRDGHSIGLSEQLTPDVAMALFSGDVLEVGWHHADALRCGIGTRANLVLLDRPWHKARDELSNVRIIRTIKDGQVIWEAA